MDETTADEMAAMLAGLMVSMTAASTADLWVGAMAVLSVHAMVVQMVG